MSWDHPISIETLILAGALTLTPVHAPQVCDSTTEYKIEYQKLQEKIEYKTKNHKVIKAVPSKLGFNCVEYAKSKKRIGTGFGSLAQKLAKVKTKTPQAGLVGVTGEGWVGHLVYVEEVKKETLIISEGNYRHGFITVREIPKSLVIGFL